MFKIIIFSAIFTITLAYPGLYERTEVHSAPLVTVKEEHGYANVGSIVKSVPSSVSHQSHSVVHSSSHVIEDVLAPAVKTSSYTTKSLLTPVIETYSASAVVKTVSSPVVHTYSAAAPVVLQTW